MSDDNEELKIYLGCFKIEFGECVIDVSYYRDRNFKLINLLKY